MSKLAVSVDKQNNACFSGRIISHLGQQVVVEFESKQPQSLQLDRQESDIQQQAPHEKRLQTIKCFVKQSLSEVIVGDYIKWIYTQDNQGQVIERLPRDNVIQRHGHGNTIKRMAANVTAMAIMLAYRPKPNWEVLDQYCVAARLCNCEPFIIFNKIDQLKPKDKQWESIKRYTDLGFSVFPISVYSDQGIQDLVAALSQHTTILIGQSGVGKSSLTQLLMPKATIATSALSKQSELGCHTTSHSYLYHLSKGGSLIDSPGIREFRLTGKYSPSSLAAGFPDIAAELGQCKFRDCSHQHEPGCRLLELQSANKLHPDRLNSYLSIIEEFGE